MSLYFNFCRPAFITLSALSSTKILRRISYSGSRCTEEGDRLDVFTSQLVLKQCDKWDIFLQNQLFRNDNDKQRDIKRERNEVSVHHDFNVVNLKHIDEIAERTVSKNDFDGVVSIISECVKCRKCPSPSVLLKILQFCSQNADVDSLLKVKALCSDIRPEVLQKYSHFISFIAVAMWVKGNLSKATELFDQAYRENKLLREHVHHTFRYLSGDVVHNRSEAALWQLVQFSETILCDFGDHIPLFYLWQSCLLSEWYTNQSIALDLMEKHEMLFNVIIQRLQYIVTIALSGHHSEVVFKLLEVLLKYKIEREYLTVILALINYKIHQRDLRGCREIVHWCEENNVELPQVWREKYLNMLLRF